MNGISFVVPCLNEERTLQQVLQRIEEVCTTVLRDRPTEILVSDNGSTDRSVAIATAFGATVVHCAERGYGANIRHGILQARHAIIIFADADNTYDLGEAPALISKLERDACGMVLGSRLSGTIEPDAMPLLHRYLGTPVLNLLINAFHRPRHKEPITDCNSGFRCFYKEQFLAWGTASHGMDFASEMLLKAFKSGTPIGEVPITLSRSDKERVPHLKTWQDGMKHLLRFFVETPGFFFALGAWLFAAGMCILILSNVVDMVDIGGMRVLGPHTTLIANLVAGTGLQIWCLGAFIALKDYKDRRPVQPAYRWMIEIREDRLFWFVCVYFLALVTILSYIFSVWQSNFFRALHLEDFLLMIIFALTGMSYMVINVLAIHILKRI